jgi:hypothetical protein
MVWMGLYTHVYLWYWKWTISSSNNTAVDIGEDKPLEARVMLL